MNLYNNQPNGLNVLNNLQGMHPQVQPNGLTNLQKMHNNPLFQSYVQTDDFKLLEAEMVEKTQADFDNFLEHMKNPNKARDEDFKNMQSQLNGVTALLNKLLAEKEQSSNANSNANNKHNGGHKNG